MQTLYTIIGALIVLALASAVFLFAWAWFFEKLNSYNDSAISAAREAARRELAHELSSRSYWFSHYPEAEALLQEVGAQAQYSSVIDFGNLRNKWEDRCKKIQNTNSANKSAN